MKAKARQTRNRRRATWRKRGLDKSAERRERREGVGVLHPCSKRGQSKTKLLEMYHTKRITLHHVKRATTKCNGRTRNPGERLEDSREKDKPRKFVRNNKKTNP